MNIRIGLGYDIHRLEKGYSLILGGCHIPFPKGSVGHSDADVLIHAIMDSLLGAMGDEDIGHRFPDNNPSYKDISSLILLEEISKLLLLRSYKIINIDTVVILESPKIAPFIEEMKINISKVLTIDRKNIGIKATTSEKLGIIGEGKGIASHAISLIEKIS